MEQVQEQECEGSVLPQDFVPTAQREKALPEVGLRLRCAEDSGEQGCNSSGERKTAENGKAADEEIPQMGEAALTAPLHRARTGLRLCQGAPKPVKAGRA